MSNSNNISNDFITTPYYIEGLYIEPLQSIIIENNETRNIQPKVMEVLTYLCSKAEQLVSADELIKACWPNQYISDSPLHKCIAQIRKALADDPKSPRFIKTVPKKGYVFIAKVKGLNVTPQQPQSHWTGELLYPGLKPYTFAQNDIFFGSRLAFNDMQSSEMLIGLGADLEHNAFSFLVEANRRFGESFKVSLDVRLLQSTNNADLLYSIKNDDHLQLGIEYYF